MAIFQVNQLMQVEDSSDALGMTISLVTPELVTKRDLDNQIQKINYYLMLIERGTVQPDTLPEVLAMLMVGPDVAPLMIAVYGGTEGLEPDVVGEVRSRSFLAFCGFCDFDLQRRFLDAPI